MQEMLLVKIVVSPPQIFESYHAIKRRVRLMCALRAHIKPSIFGNIFSKTEKDVNTFSIPEKFFFQK